MPRNVRSHLNPRYKPASVSFRSGHPLSILFARFLTVSVFLLSPVSLSLFLFFSLFPSLSTRILPPPPPPSVSVAVPLFSYGWLLSYRRATSPLHRRFLPLPLFLSFSPLSAAPLLSRRLRNLRYDREQHRAPTAIFFRVHDNALRKLIILVVVGVLRAIFGSTTHSCRVH